MSDTTNRWYLWEFRDGNRDNCVYSFAYAGGSPWVHCTEVRLAPVDAVICEKGSREWATIMAMRGKRVGNEIRLGNDGLPYSAWYEIPAEEPLRCPVCGTDNGDIENSSVRGWRCECRCGASSPWRPTLAEAREAFRKMGGAK